MLGFPAYFGPAAGSFLLELELELIQTHTTQRPVLRIKVGARALRMLIGKYGWTGRAGAGVQGTCLWAWVSGAPVRAGWISYKQNQNCAAQAGAAGVSQMRARVAEQQGRRGRRQGG